LNLPRGKLVETLKGGPDVLKKLLIGLGGRDFNGYLKIDTRREGIDSHGIIIVMGSRAVMAVHIWKARVFGPASLRLVLRDSLEENCTLRLHSLPDEARAEMTLATHKFTSARISIEDFDFARESNSVLKESFVPGEVAAANRPYPVPSGPHVEQEAAALYTSMSEIGVDTSDLKRKEEELSRREMQLRLEIDQKLKERDQIKAEEENFLKMDEVLSKLVKQREEERAGKEVQLDKKMSQLQQQVSRREEDVASREEEIKRELDRLSGEKEEMKHREEKLLEMEKMFRRVLTNTEDRLKRKEEELLKKEEELEKFVRLKMREMEEMRAQTAAARTSGEAGGTELVKVEEALKIREMALRRKEDELEDRVREFRRAVTELEKKKSAAETAPGPPAATGQPGDGRYPEKELQQLFRAVDSLFDKLPDDVIHNFAMSKDFELYESIMGRLGLAKK
jgi:hypothetical protein